MPSVLSVDWRALFVPSGSLLELVLRGSILYLSILGAMRILRRDAGSLGTADLLVVVLVADAAQNGMAGEYRSITEGVLLVGLIFCWDFLLDWLGYRYTFIARLLHAPPLALVRDGRPIPRNLRSEMLTLDDLKEQLREQGIDDIARVKRCILEGDGKMSVITYGEREPGPQAPEGENLLSLSAEATLALYSMILCAIDFSGHSRRALRLGLALAARQGSEVAAVHAIDPLLAEAAATTVGGGALRTDAESELLALVEAERGAVPGAPPVGSIVRVGPPAREILATARDTGAGLVAMGTQGLGGLRKLFFGSIAEKVLRDALLPVLAVPTPEGDEHQGTPVIEVVIASVELDQSAQAVTQHAAAFARAFGLPLTLLHVVPPVDGIPRAAQAARRAERQHEANAHARLTELARALEPGLRVDIEVRCGAAADEIAAAAVARHALITIASSGHIDHRPGSIAYRVLCLSDSPVLAVPGASPTR